MATIRITAGTLRGRRIPVPPGARPTSERARQAFFDIIGDRIVDAHFLDLYAGSGIFSFEALSRGAATALAVDRLRRSVEAIERHASTFGVDVETRTGAVVETLPRLRNREFDIVYADPPYDSGEYEPLIRRIDADMTLAPEAIVVVEHRSHDHPFSDSLSRLQLSRREAYGEVCMQFFTLRPQ